MDQHHKPTSIIIIIIIYNYQQVFSLTEPGSAPRNVQVRPLSSSTMVIQWDEPETPNGQVTVTQTLRSTR